MLIFSLRSASSHSLPESGDCDFSTLYSFVPACTRMNSSGGSNSTGSVSSSPSVVGAFAEITVRNIPLTGAVIAPPSAPVSVAVHSVRHPRRFSGFPPESEMRFGAYGEWALSMSAGSVDISTPRNVTYFVKYGFGLPVGISICFKAVLRLLIVYVNNVAGHCA